MIHCFKGSPSNSGNLNIVTINDLNNQQVLNSNETETSLKNKNMSGSYFDNKLQFVIEQVEAQIV